eukprot:GHVT01080403.1.p1 GENE.GHVT01080403.1~~GHVT01080403.1.p1  ORF type:complete len:183 (+),score=28.83 GHVT01080403.1:1655-2203(+)
MNVWVIARRMGIKNKSAPMGLGGAGGRLLLLALLGLVTSWQCAIAQKIHAQRRAVAGASRASGSARVGGASVAAAPPSSSLVFNPNSPAGSDAVIELDESSYYVFVGAKPLAVILYYAPWCYFSRQIMPEFDAAAKILAHHKPPVGTKEKYESTNSNIGRIFYPSYLSIFRMDISHYIPLNG